MRIEGYARFGGRHCDSAALAHLLGHEGVVDPRTKAALSEPLLFALGGGAGLGVGNCPSIARAGLGAGLTLVGRELLLQFDGTFQRKALERLGVAFEAAESGSPRAAAARLSERLAQGHPVAAWCARSIFYHGGDPSAAGMGLPGCTLVVYAFDADHGKVEVADLAPQSIELSLAEWERARAGIAAHKSRILSMLPPEKNARALSASRLADVLVDGFRQAVDAQRRPKVKALSAIGLAELARAIGNLQAKQGWYKSFPGGRLYWPLKECFLSIEGEGLAGPLMRELWADALEEASDLVKKPALKSCAKSWRALGQQWGELAEALLPDAVGPFKRAKSLLRRRRSTFLEQGGAARAALAQLDAELAKLETSVLENLPMESEDAQGLLLNLGRRLDALVAGERAAFDALAKAVL